ncbi:MAG: amino acid permease, partial [Streptosporangiaceae bacterium]
AAPLTILAATVAVALLAFAVAEFTRAEPSAGSFITYVETALGARAGVATALLVAVGYTIAITAVFTMSGGLVALTLSHYTSWHPPWGPISVVLTVGAMWLTARGVKLSTNALRAAVVVQVAIMIAVCLLVLVDQRAALSGIPFSWGHLTGGLAGLSAGFPLALFMFIGVNALLFMACAGLGIIGVWWVLHLITGGTGAMNPVGLYAECSTLATIMILFVYLLTMISLPCSCGAATGTRSRSSATWRSRPLPPSP